jgi:hypothetical protein
MPASFETVSKALIVGQGNVSDLIEDLQELPEDSVPDVFEVGHATTEDESGVHSLLTWRITAEWSMEEPGTETDEPV